MVTSKKGKETPAEQLLRMIEGSPGGEGFTSPMAVPPVRRLADALRGFLSQWWRWVVPVRRQADTFLWNLRLVYRVLWLALAAMGAYVVMDLLLIQPVPKLDRLAGPPPGDSAPAHPAPVQERPILRPLSEYLASVQVRNPFTGMAGGIAQEGPAVQTTKRRLEDLAGGLAVVGIDRGPNPEAIIEDTAQQRTYFVKVGDEVNGMVVKAITAKGVVVGYEGEELLLK